MRGRAAALSALALLAVVPPAGAAGIRVTSSISPRPMRFGDVIHATLTVRAGGTATVQEGFSPFQVLRKTSTTSSDGGQTVTTFRFDLQCLEVRCAPGSNGRNVPLSASHVHVGSTAETVRVAAVHVVPRVTPHEVATPARSMLHPISPPPPVYRFSPTTVRRVLVVAALLLVLVAIALVLPLVRRPRQVPTDPPIDPLEGALALVRASRSRGPADRRRALGLLSRVLRARDARPVAQAAADLAWSEAEPDPDGMTRLADRVEDAP